MRNRNYSFSRRQLLALCTVFFLSPALRLVPGVSTQLAGRAAWLSPLLALPLILLYICFITALSARFREGEGLAELMLRALGARAGRAALTLTALWFILYGAFTLRSGAERIISTMYPDSGPGLFMVTMGLLGLVAALDAPRTLVRAANIFLAAVLGVLAVVLIFALFSVERENLFPVTLLDLPRAAAAAAASVDVASLPLYAALFLAGLRTNEPGARRACFAWAFGAAGLLALILAAIVGCFGAELAARLTHPFFSLVKNLRFFNTVERVEAFVVSLWVFTDFTVVSVCFIAAQHALRLVLGRYAPYSGEGLLSLRAGRWVIAPVAAASVALAFLIAPENVVFDKWSRLVIPALNAVAAFVLLPIIYIVGRAKKRI